ncbi:MAG TPA: pyrroline-5-carboxylate reductase, partial [Acetobacteraceae bacterium]|nr:pyrroline-5-carboxylate reductase [Acetobacteraceae bacterium]
PSVEAARLAGDGVSVVPSGAVLPAGFAPEVVVLAVKPQIAAEAVPFCGRFAKRALYISIMAGKSLAGLADLVGPEAAVVRAMPNTPASVRQGITVAIAGAHVSAGQLELAHGLLAAVGSVAWVDEERLLDPVTAISGGGPAYVFLLTELLERAALAHGIAPELARLMARQTIVGSAALLAASEEDAADLRRAVTSKGGTTERALGVLMADGAWPAAMEAAIDAASARSAELGG